MPQERFSREGWLLWYPPFSSTPILEGIVRAGDVIDNFSNDGRRCGRCHPCGHKERAHRGLEISHSRTRDSHSAHIDPFLLERRREEKKNEEQISSNQLSTKSDQIQQSYAFDNAVLW